MELKFIKNGIMDMICAIFLFSSSRNKTTFALFEDFDILGGNYGSLVNECNEIGDNNEKYTCRYLISPNILNRWADEVQKIEGKNHLNDFLIGDFYHKWAPAIIMEKGDHYIITTYWDEKLINNESNRIIYNGDILNVLNEEMQLINYLFPDKYYEVLKEVSQYIRYLNFKFIDSRTLIMSYPYIDQTVFLLLVLICKVIIYYFRNNAVTNNVDIMISINYNISCR